MKRNNFPKILCNLLLGVTVFICSTAAYCRVTVPKTAATQESEAKEAIKNWNSESFLFGAKKYLQAAEIFKESKNPPKESFCLVEAGRLQKILGNKQYANLLFNRAQIVSRNAEDFSGEAIAVAEISLLEIESGNFTEAQKLQGAALDLAQNHGSDLAMANALFCAAEYYYWQNDLTKSLIYYEQSLQKWSDLNDLDGEAKTLLSLGYLLLEQNKLSLGRSKFDLALEKWRQLDSERGQTLAYYAIGTMLNMSDRPQKALIYYQEAESSFPNDIDFFDRGGLYNGIGSIYEYYRDLPLAISYREKALQCFQNASHSGGQLATLMVLARLTYMSGKADIAPSYFKSASVIAQRTHDKFYQAQIDKELGDFYLFVGNLKNASSEYEKATAYFSLHKNIREIGLIQAKLGEIYQNTSEYKLARTSFQKSLDINHDIQNRFAESDTLFQLAKLDLLEDNLENALYLTKQSITLMEANDSEVFNFNLKRSYFSNVYDRYELYVNLLMQKNKESRTGDNSVQALQSVEKSRSRSLIESLHLSEANFTKDANPELVRREKELHNLLNIRLDKLTELLSSREEKTKIEKVDDEIRNLQNERAEIEAKFKQDSPIYSAIQDPGPFDVGEFQEKVLDDTSLLLEYSLGKEESYLWVVGKTEFNSYVLPPREEIESRVEKLRSLLNQRAQLANEGIDVFQKRVADAEGEYSREARALSNDLLGQAADKLVGKRLIVVADGKMQYFPLAALPLPNSATDEPILLSNEVVYEPSAAALMLIKNISATRATPQKDLFLVSDPVFSKADERLGRNADPNTGFVATVLGHFRSFDSLENLPRLPASMEEANSITNVVSASATTAHSGFAANRENVLNSGIEDYKVIHFATHGLLDEKRPELSGIVLSLFDEGGNQQNGGFIRLQDVYGMNLNADLVVLSACDTGLGKEIKGEGLMSLNNAFLQAGAKSVVSSLWRVEDSATKQLMTDFYRGMASGGLTSSEALRQAQIKLHNDPRFSSPFYWASFTAQGNFSTAPHFSRGFSVWIYILGLGLISLFGIYRLRRVRNRTFSHTG